MLGRGEGGADQLRRRARRERREVKTKQKRSRAPLGVLRRVRR